MSDLIKIEPRWKVDRCICFKVSFTYIVDLAIENGASTAEEAQEHILFGHKCRLCLPFIDHLIARKKDVEVAATGNND